MLEGLILLAAVASAPAAARPAAEPPPPVELLEFIGEWSDDEAAQLLDPDNKSRRISRQPGAGPKRSQEADDGH